MSDEFFVWLLTVLWMLQAILFYIERDDTAPSKKHLFLLTLTLLFSVLYVTWRQP
mgnify:CR=1 FL=1